MESLKGALGSPGRRWEDNIKVDLREIVIGEVCALDSSD
jgi:hypothetical protein